MTGTGSFRNAHYPFAALGICVLVWAVAALISSDVLHWFVVPTAACGFLCCRDAFGLFEKRPQGVIDPVALLGAFGVYFFYIGPLLHVARDYWFINPTFAPAARPDDWRPWLGYMGILNFTGLLVYRICHRRFGRNTKEPRQQSGFVYAVSPSSLRAVGPVFLVVTFALQIYIFASFGGINAYLNSCDKSLAGNNCQLQGMGWELCIAESFPTLMLIYITAQYRDYLRRCGSLFIVAGFGLLFPLIMLFGGLRGSRSNTVFALLYAAGIVHVTVRRLPWRFYCTMGLGLITFLYFYGFFKAGQQQFLEMLGSPDSVRTVERQTGRTLDRLFLGDFERSDIQAYLLFRSMRAGGGIEYALGETYVADALSVVPQAILPDRPAGKVWYGTDALFGEEAYAPNRNTSTKVYGLAGEALLNFGVYGIPVAFAFLGIAVGRLRAMIRRLGPADARAYIAPMLSVLCVVALSSDLDNLAYAFLRHAFMPVIMMWWVSKKLRCRQAPGVAAGRKSMFLQPSGLRGAA